MKKKYVRPSIKENPFKKELVACARSGMGNCKTTYKGK